jgi:hypothetical protein
LWYFCLSNVGINTALTYSYFTVIQLVSKSCSRNEGYEFVIQRNSSEALGRYL